MRRSETKMGAVVSVSWLFISAHCDVRICAGAKRTHFFQPAQKSLAKRNTNRPRCYGSRRRGMSVPLLYSCHAEF